MNAITYSPQYRYLSDNVDKEFEKAVDVVTKRVNKHYSGLFSSISRNDVLKVINRYVRRLNSSPSTPPYNSYYVEKVPKPEYFQLPTDIAAMAGVSIDLARKILKQLEYADKDGSIAKGIYNPRVKKSAPKKEKPTQNNPGPDFTLPKEQDPLQDEETVQEPNYLLWGGIGIGGGLIAAMLLGKGKKRKKR